MCVSAFKPCFTIVLLCKKHSTLSNYCRKQLWSLCFVTKPQHQVWLKQCLEKRFQLRAVWLNLNLLESTKLCLTPNHVVLWISRPDWHLEVFRPATCSLLISLPITGTQAQTEPRSVWDKLSLSCASAGHVVRLSSRIPPTLRTNWIRIYV